MDKSEYVAFETSVRRFFERQAPAGRVARWRADGIVEREFWLEAAQAGLLGVSLPAEYGGGGGSFYHEVYLLEQCIRHDVSGFTVGLHNCIVAGYIAKYGTEEQRRKWLPLMATGKAIGAIALTEPDAGSDLGAIRMRADPTDDGYRLNGQKAFVSNGHICDLVIVLAKTSTDVRNGSSLFLVEPSTCKGFGRGPRLDKIGHDAHDTAEMFFNDADIPAGSLLGGVGGLAFGQLMDELPKERLIIAVQAVTMAEEALALTVDYSRNRRLFGVRLMDMQNTQFVLAERQADIAMARLFVDHCVRLQAEGRCDSVTASIAKLKATELLCKVVDDCLQLFGGMGYINETRIARMYRDARAFRIYGGTSEAMKALIAASL